MRGKICSRVDLGNSMRVTIIDVTAVPGVQVSNIQSSTCKPISLISFLREVIARE